MTPVHQTSRQTSAARIALAVFAAAGIGGGLLLVLTATMHAAFHFRDGGMAEAVDLATHEGSAFWMLFAGVWLIGIVMAGGPLWWGLHRLGRTGWRTFLAAGLAVPAVLFLAVQYTLSLSSGHPASDYLTGPLLFGALLSGIGGIVSLVLWRIAYVQARPGDVVSS